MSISGTLDTKAYSEPCQTSKTEFLGKIVKGWNLNLTYLTGFWIRLCDLFFFNIAYFQIPCCYCLNHIYSLMLQLCKCRFLKSSSFEKLPELFLGSSIYIYIYIYIYNIKGIWDQIGSNQIGCKLEVTLFLQKLSW